MACKRFCMLFGSAPPGLPYTLHGSSATAAPCSCTQSGLGARRLYGGPKLTRMHLWPRRLQSTVSCFTCSHCTPALPHPSHSMTQPPNTCIIICAFQETYAVAGPDTDEIKQGMTHVMSGHMHISARRMPSCLANLPARTTGTSSLSPSSALRLCSWCPAGVTGRWHSSAVWLQVVV